MGEETKFSKLSMQALVQLMISLQKCLAEQSDIVPILNNFDWFEKDGQLFINNPIEKIEISNVDEYMEEDEDAVF